MVKGREEVSEVGTLSGKDGVRGRWQEKGVGWEKLPSAALMLVPDAQQGVLEQRPCLGFFFIAVIRHHDRPKQLIEENT